MHSYFINLKKVFTESRVRLIRFASPTPSKDCCKNAYFRTFAPFLADKKIFGTLNMKFHTLYKYFLTLTRSALFKNSSYSIFNFASKYDIAEG